MHIARYAKSTQSNKFTISLQYLKENIKDEVDFLPADRRQKSDQSDTIILDMCGQACPNYPKLPKITQRFPISLQYFKKQVSDEVDFLHADEHESLLQIDTLILMGMVKHSQSSQNSKFAMSLQYLIKEVRVEVDFLHADKHQNFLQGDIIIIDGHDQAFKYLK